MLEIAARSPRGSPCGYSRRSSSPGSSASSALPPDVTCAGISRPILVPQRSDRLPSTPSMKRTPLPSRTMKWAVSWHRCTRSRSRRWTTGRRSGRGGPAWIATRALPVHVMAVPHGELVLAQRSQQPVGGGGSDAQRGRGLGDPQLALLPQHAKQPKHVVRRPDRVGRSDAPVIEALRLDRAEVLKQQQAVREAWSAG